jgi:hypothetical protein
VKPERSLTRDGDFDPSIPTPMILIAVLGLGGLPQLQAEMTMNLILRAVGKRAAPPAPGSPGNAPSPRPFGKRRM